MAAPKGNKFWELRSKHGRDKLFKTPELMWEAACEYFAYIQDNPLEQEEIVKYKDYYEKVPVSKMRPFTLIGLCLYLDCSSSYFRAFKSELKEKDKDFLTVITRIEDIIYNQKFEGASSGFFNANIIARDLGLIDKVESNMKVKVDQYSDWTEEQINAELERLKNK